MSHSERTGPKDPDSTAVAREGDSRPTRPSEPTAAESFLLLLARAVRQFHTYPATNPLCVEAITACQKALVSLPGGDDFTVSITPHGLRVDGVTIASAAMLDQELGRRLRRARIEGLAIARDASRRDLSRFCAGLVRCTETAETKTVLADLLAEDGVSTITLRVLQQPEVLDIGAPTIAQRQLLEHERRLHEGRKLDGPVGHLYPPNKGWVRVDPTTPPNDISLAQLAILVDDPNELAAMLGRLSNDTPEADVDAEAALEQRFSEVATLFAALEPRLARVMFGRLARVVLDMGADRRQRLLRRTILPGLLDGKMDGAILQDFPDPDLAESLCLLLDLETAAPEVVITALDRLNLAPERREAVVPLVEAQMRGRGLGETARRSGADTDLDRHARRLTRIDSSPGKSFSEFAAFDLAVDETTTAAVGELRQQIVVTDAVLAELGCLTNLVRLQPNPEVVAGFLSSILTRFEQLERRSRWDELAAHAGQLRELAAALEERRPDVATTIHSALGEFATRDRAANLLMLHERDDDGRATADRLFDALGAALAPSFLSLIAEPVATVQASRVVNVMSSRALTFAPAVVTGFSTCPPTARVHLVKVLGFAGEGYEAIIGEQFAARDERTTREALRALARIGSSHAAALVAAQLQDREASIRKAALETLARFPRLCTDAHVKTLLGDRHFVLRYPEIAVKLLDRATSAGARDIDMLLRDLSSLRFRFWNRPLVRVARRAKELLAS